MDTVRQRFVAFVTVPRWSGIRIKPLFIIDKLVLMVRFDTKRTYPLLSIKNIEYFFSLDFAVHRDAMLICKPRLCKTSITLSRCKVGLPFSSSDKSRVPIWQSSASSVWVKPSCLRFAISNIPDYPPPLWKYLKNRFKNSSVCVACLFWKLKSTRKTGRLSMPIFLTGAVETVIVTDKPSYDVINHWVLLASWQW